MSWRPVAKTALARTARKDIRELMAYRRSMGGIVAAEALQKRLHSTIRMIENNPRIGRHRPELTPLPLRFFTNTGIVIAYRESPLQIVRVIDGRRDLFALFGRGW